MDVNVDALAGQDGPTPTVESGVVVSDTATCRPWCDGRGVRRAVPGLMTQDGVAVRSSAGFTYAAERLPTRYGTMVGITYEYCFCAEAEAALRRLADQEAASESSEMTGVIARIWQRAELPRRLGRYTVESYLEQPGVERGAQRSLLEKLGRWQSAAQSFGCWLLLMGAQGTGKTGLGVSLLQEDLAVGRSGLYVVAPDLLERIRETYGPGGDRDDAAVAARGILAQAIDVDTLLLDDVGKEGLSAWGRERLFRLINARDAWQRRTIITTNLGLAELEAHLGEFSFDRIRGNATHPTTGESFFVKLTGPSRRGVVCGTAPGPIERVAGGDDA
jgi:DNA replication protein DnaC